MTNSDIIMRLRDYGADIDKTLDRFVNDEDLFCRCIKDFLTDENFDFLGKAMSQGDATKAFEAVHALKGMSGNLGLTALYKSTIELTEELRGQSKIVSDKEYKILISELDRLKKVLSE